MLPRAIESGSRVHLDSLGGATGNRVLIMVSFGQLWRSYGHFCPNQGHIRTASVLPRAIDSESGAHSDSFDVAMWQSSPNQGLIRTASMSPCGNRVRIKGSFGQVRCRHVAIDSESRAHSDRFDVAMWQSSPNQGLIRTVSM
ncbi:hypothetical protein [Bacillus sp. UNC438CL73TsuS30]|uniref:hypothetical protein n=1 Tax=Bacillus sp. UNC438CL73TsuS30 TaxID=1340434 RepID=UPI0018CC4468|nr:hypothetical protein [Bacillus sp. UNC438CL73TsuS30]